jgi:two-component system nitrogen regulation response regulator GlnG
VFKPNQQNDDDLGTSGDFATAVEFHIGKHFAMFGRDLPPDGLYDRIISEVERPLLRLTLAAVRGNQLKAAKLLGINRNTLRKKLTGLDIDPGGLKSS